MSVRMISIAVALVALLLLGFSLRGGHAPLAEDSKFRQDMAGAADGATIVIPARTTVVVDTSTPISITHTNITLRGEGCGSVLQVTGGGNLFDVSAQGFVVRDLCIQVASSESRAAASLWNLRGGALLGAIQNVTISGAPRINNGRIFNADLEQTGTGEWLLEHLRVVGGSNWTNAVFLRTTRGTVSGFTVADFISFTGTSYADGALVFDTGVDTAKLSGLEIGSTGIALQTRNSRHGYAPRWIHCTDCRLESGGFDAGYPVVKIDDVRDFKFIGGYVASGNIGFLINGGNQITVAASEIVNIGQHCVLLAGTATQTTFEANTLEDCGISADKRYDYFHVASGVQHFQFVANTVRQQHRNQTGYAYNIERGGSDFYTIIAGPNQLRGSSGLINDLGTGQSKWVALGSRQ